MSVKLVSLGLALSALGLACSPDKVITAANSGPGAGAPVPAVDAGAAAASTAPPPLPRMEFAENDFAESDRNRDPFRTFASVIGAEVKKVAQSQREVILPQFSLDELKLVAIISGEGMPPTAMFVDPTGMGVAVKRGEHLSKSDALISRISPDRVFLQIEDEAGKGKPTERVVELHAGELANE